jgi:fucose permease
MKTRVLVICYIMLVWFVISFVTNLIGPLMPIIIGDFHLSLGLAGFLPFSFFLAYGLISIPAGALVEARGIRTTLLAAFGMNLLGCLVIALYPSYASAICGLFVIGLGMAMLQVVINPLTRATGGEGHFAFFSVMGQLVFGLASCEPLVFAMLMHRPGSEHEALVWVQFHWAFLFVFVALIALTAWLRLPSVELAESERWRAGGVSKTHGRSIRAPVLPRLCLRRHRAGLDWMSQFLSTYHTEPTKGANAVGSFWGLMSIGCVLGLVLLKLLDAKVVLARSRCWHSYPWGWPVDRGDRSSPFPCRDSSCQSCIRHLSFGLNSVKADITARCPASCTGILGGAVVPLLVGFLGDRFGLRIALLSVFVTLGYILSVCYWARPLVRNETFLTRRKRASLESP